VQPIKLTVSGQASSIQMFGALLRTPWQAKLTGKMDLAKSQIDEPFVDHLLDYYH
jgi:hypothetical protein